MTDLQDSKRSLEPTVAELFAGVGGFRLGLEASGWKVSYSNQWEPSTKKQHASNVYVHRFGASGHSNEDISKVARLPLDPALMVGGFPCQDYSVAKSKSSATGLEGKKGVLWWEIERLVALHEPRFLFLENVDRLLKSPSQNRGRDFAIMLRSLANLGYSVEWRIVNSAEYGFPQRRKRVFIIASLGPKFCPSTDYITTESVLARALPVVPSVSKLRNIDIPESLLQISETFNLDGKSSPFANAGCMSGDLCLTAEVASAWKGKPSSIGDILQPDSEVPPEYWVSDDMVPRWEYLKGAKSEERVHSSGYRWKYSEGRMAFPDGLDRPSRTILTGEGGSTPSRFKHIIQTASGFRRLTPIELERLNGFPDGWTTEDETGPVSDVRRAFFMGNALVVGLIERVGEVLLHDLRKLSKE